MSLKNACINLTKIESEYYNKPLIYKGFDVWPLIRLHIWRNLTAPHCDYSRLPPNHEYQSQPFKKFYTRFRSLLYNEHLRKEIYPFKYSLKTLPETKTWLYARKENFRPTEDKCHYTDIFMFPMLRLNGLEDAHYVKTELENYPTYNTNNIATIQLPLNAFLREKNFISTQILLSHYKKYLNLSIP